LIEPPLHVKAHALSQISRPELLIFAVLWVSYYFVIQYTAFKVVSFCSLILRLKLTLLLFYSCLWWSLKIYLSVCMLWHLPWSCFCTWKLLFLFTLNRTIDLSLSTGPFPDRFKTLLLFIWSKSLITAKKISLAAYLFVVSL
jgi:hypothetical protein